MFSPIERLTDSYKFSHHKQRPPDTTRTHFYLSARKAQPTWGSEVVFFGLQYFIKQYLVGAAVDANHELEKSRMLVNAHLGGQHFNLDGWQHINERHEGRLPVSIRAVPEGTVVPNGEVLLTIENTDPRCPWLPGHLETMLVQLWGMCTVATHSRDCKKIIRDALDLSGDIDGLPFKLHDFGMRGVPSMESAAMLGAAHLVNFQGTDTFAAIDMLRDFYGANMPGSSIPASEHSTITSWGTDGELAAFSNMLDQFPEGLVACVSDTNDIFNACRNYWGGELRDRVMRRNGTLVVRPDSGELPGTVLQVLDILGESFGTETNAKGFKVLPPQVRVIQGDGINMQSLAAILTEMLKRKWSADNIAFGSGGGLLQKFDRDTLGFAMKCSAVERGGVWHDAYKNPITDSGKRSKRGRLSLYRDDRGGLYTAPLSKATGSDALVEVFRDGELLVDHSLEDIRKRAELPWL